MKDKIIIGYDLGDIYSQISYCTYDSDAPTTISSVAGSESFNIPTVLCKRKGVNQWFFGRDAQKHAEVEDGILVTGLVNSARKGEYVKIDEDEFDPIALLALFMKRSMTLLSSVANIDQIDAMMITCPQLDGTMVEILNAIVPRLGLKTNKVFFQGRVESFYSYTIRQPEELWFRQVLVCDYNLDSMKVYRLECNRRTTPVVAFVEEKEYGFFPCSDEQKDDRFLSILKEVCDDRLISSAYLIGEGFDENWMNESLRYLCRGRRVFQGNNLYSKGACFGMKEKLEASEVGKAHVFLGNDKLKANIGMKVVRQGNDSYFALLDAGISWFEAQNTVEFLLPEGNVFSLVITPLNGRDIKIGEVTLDGLPERKNAASRLRLNIRMTSENRIELEVEDLGFGEIFTATNLKWKESFEV